ncbi:MAG: hypothetical protein A3H44_15220 [Gammaproteobacteria bacterium RIFCSPLOWO2_02_FULL_57_10]|nr:MAG: hypothetical protein A3H44_15220 [Gammaproteobacteria bacterium RIFCSPLOWO2_02_FULL_57_10]
MKADSLPKRIRLKILFPAMAWLPEKIAYALANLIGWYDWRTKQSERSAIEKALHSIPVFGDRDITLWSRRYYQMMARDTLDCFRMPNFTPGNTNRLIRVNNAEALAAAKAAGNGVIMVISHFGRFFMLGPGLKFSGLEFGMLTTDVDERNPHYDTIGRWYINTKLHNTQLFSRGTWITIGDDHRRIYRALREGEIMLIALDGMESNSSSRILFPFLGGILSLPEGIVRIAATTGAKLVYAATVDHGYGVEINIYGLPDDPRQAMGAAVGILERDIIARPWHWWQWTGLGVLWQTETKQE